MMLRKIQVASGLLVVALAGCGGAPDQATSADARRAQDPAAPVVVTVDASSPGATINRHLFGQFAEHLGHGIYGGVWVGRDSPIPNTREIGRAHV